MNDDPFVSLSPGMKSGAPTLNNTRLSVEIVAEIARAESVDAAVDTYQELGIRREDVLVACWYMSLYGARCWRGWWGRWADAHGRELWSGEWDAIPDPPMQEKP